MLFFNIYLKLYLHSTLKNTYQKLNWVKILQCSKFKSTIICCMLCSNLEQDQWIVQHFLSSFCLQLKLVLKLFINEKSNDLSATSESYIHKPTSIYAIQIVYRKCYSEGPTPSLARRPHRPRVTLTDREALVIVETYPPPTSPPIYPVYLLFVMVLMFNYRGSP